MIPWHSARHFLGFIACWLVFQPTTRALSQDTTSYNEVYLTFQYRGIANVYITSYYVDGEFYLPVDELFNVLEISHQVDLNNLTVSGTYFEEGRDYVLNFSRQTARIGDRTFALQADDFLVREIDFFVRPQIFEELFDLVFTVDFNNLTLELEPRTRSPLPVIARYEREQRRRRSSMNQPRFQRSFFPLRYGRDYDIVDGAFLDYNYTVLTTDGEYPTFSLSNALGTEFLGGDLQGSSFANFSNNFSDFTTNNLRWRFVNESYGVFSSAYVGQTQTEGVVSRNIRGAKITNKPVEPRLLFDQYVVEGNTTPLSEVELYLNNALIDFQEADELGNYRFVVPLTYGSSQYSIRIYTPSGQEIERNARIQIPFDYIPPGEIDYTVSGGELEYPIFGTTDGGYIASSVISAGLTRWLTAKLSAEYLSDYHTDGIPSVTGGFSARLFSNYLVTAQANSDQYYRLTSSVVYPNGASWNLNYEYNPGDSRLYNPSGSDHLARLNLYTPFRIGKVPINIRWSSFYQRDNRYNSLRYRVDLNTRLSRLNIRFGYQDQQFGDLQFTATPLSRLTNTYTYTFGRHPGVPGYLRGSYLRGQVSYLPQLEELEELEFQYSRDIFGTGQIQLTASRNFFADFDMVGLNITIDLSGIRTNSTARATRNSYTLAQNFRGSVGLDFESGQMLFNNRQQVGQAGAAVRLYIDNDNDGIYDPAVDDPVRDPALRIGRAGGRTTVKNGINYISQLLPYYRYNIDINKSALENPLLVPEVNNFSIITDPNQYKSIDVPFYLSGVISGQVQRAEPGGSRGIPGLRLH
ncbi:MAG: hypothetical protein R3224_08285, partial [Balneolaceae bacterium]|nr:hypothetical protein [Balneolaceae bacterium]